MAAVDDRTVSYKREGAVVALIDFGYTEMPRSPLRCSAMFGIAQAAMASFSVLVSHFRAALRPDVRQPLPESGK